MPRISATMPKVQKLDNSEARVEDKINIRESVLAEIGSEASVFDAYAGEGNMHAAVWSKARHYVGCDLRMFMDHRKAFVADNSRVMRAVDLTQFNIFDFDAYGSPWTLVHILAHRRPVQPGEKIGIVLTDGSFLALKNGTPPKALMNTAGVKGKHQDMIRHIDEIISAAIVKTAQRMSCSIERRWQAIGIGRSMMRYTGLVLRGK